MDSINNYFLSIQEISYLKMIHTFHDRQSVTFIENIINSEIKNGGKLNLDANFFRFHEKVSFYYLPYSS